MRKLISFLLYFQLLNVAFSSIKEVLVKQGINFFIDINKSIIKDLNTNNIIDPSSMPIIDIGNYCASDEEKYTPFQKWWTNFDKKYFLPYKCIKTNNYSSNKKTRMDDKGSIWLYFEVISNYKRIIFSCFIPNWPGYKHVPNVCSNELKGLLFFPATPNKMTSLVTGQSKASFDELPAIIKPRTSTISGMCANLSVCWINLCANVLSLYSIYGIISIDLNGQFAKLSDKLYYITNTNEVNHLPLMNSIFNCGRSTLSKFYIFRSNT